MRGFNRGHGKVQDRQDVLVLTVAELAERLGARLVGPGSARVLGVNSVEQAAATEVCFAASRKHYELLAESSAAGVITGDEIDGIEIPQLIAGSVDAALIKALNLFAKKLTPIVGVHATAVVDKAAEIGEGVGVGPGACISRGARIGAGTVISAGCVIGEDVVIGGNCRLDSNVVVYHDCRIGDNCVIQANSTIGSVGFGYSVIDGWPELIPHNGGVILEDCVEIGANCCVDRAKFGNTVIGAGTKLDNQVQIAHNVVTGKCCLMAAQVGISGSVCLGDGVIIGGQAGLADHMKLGNGAQVGGGAAVINDVGDGQKVWGSPAIDVSRRMRIIALTRRLPKMAEQVKELAKKVEELEAAKDNRR